MVSREGRHEKGEIGYRGGQSSRRRKGRKEMRLEGEDKGRRRRDGDEDDGYEAERKLSLIHI